MEYRKVQYKKMEAVLEIENVKDMIRSGDYAEAKDKLHEVKKLFRGLDGIFEMTTVSDILYWSDFDILGCGCDWYRILQVGTDADQSVLQYQYNKFITLLEPISTTFPGTKLALETVENAFLVLLDPGKRLEFDKKRAASWNGHGSTGVNKPCDEKFYDFGKTRTAVVFVVGQVWAGYDEENMPRKYALISSIDKSPFAMHVNWLEPVPVIEDEESWCKAGLPVVCGFFQVDKTHQTVVASPGIFSHILFGSTTQNEPIEIYPKKHEIWAIYKDWNPFEWIKNPVAKKTCKLQIVEILTGYSNRDEDVVVVGVVKVKGLRTVFKRYTKNGNEQPFTIPGKCLYMFSHSLPAYRFVAGEINDSFTGMLHLDPLATPDLLDCTPDFADTTTTAANIPPRRSLEASEAKPVKCKWSVEDFVSGQIWAVQDGFDSMPRQYVVIVDKPVSGRDVKVSILKPQPILNEERCWVEQKLPIVCGLFKVGGTAIHMTMSQFSHLVNYEYIRNESFYKISPKKGEIWVMYKDWDSKWETSDFSSYECGIVEIVTDFCNESGLMVARLEEVPGCATFFRKQLYDGFELIRSVPRTEMLSFSHKIAALTIHGIEVHGIPEGSCHLEANSLPGNHR